MAGMYQPLDNFGSHLMDLFNAQNEFTNTAVGIIDKEIEKKAKNDAFYFETELDNQIQGFMDEMSRSSDWEGFLIDEQKFFADVENGVAKASKDNKFYARNPYTREMYNKIIATKKEQVHNQILASRTNFAKNDAVNTMNNSIATIKNTYYRQEMVDKAKEAIDLANSVVGFNEIQKTQYLDDVKAQAARTEAYNDYFNMYERNIPEEEIDKGIRASLKDYDFFNSMTKEQQQQAIESGVKNAQIEIKSHQDQVYTDTNNVYLDLLQSVALGKEDPQTLIYKIRNQIKNVENYQMFDMTSNTKETCLKKLDALLSPITKDDGISESTKKTAYKTLINEKMAWYVDAAINGLTGNENAPGYSSMYAARDAFIEEVVKPNLPTDENFYESYSTYINDFVDAWTKRMGTRRPELIQYTNSLKKLPEVITNNSGFKSLTDDDQKTIAGDLTAYIFDTMANTDMATVDVNALIKNTNNFADKLVAKELGLISATTGFFTGSNDEKRFNNSISDTEKDLIFTDMTGQTHYIGGAGTKEKLENLQQAQSQDLAKTLNLSVKEGAASPIHKIGYETTDRGTDKNSTMLYEVDGVLYKYGSGKNKAKLYSSTDGKTWTEEERNASKRKTAKEAKTAQAKEKFNEYTEKKQQQRNNAIRLLGTGYPLNGATQEMWDQTDAATKIDIAEKFIRDPKNKEKVKELLNK